MRLIDVDELIKKEQEREDAAAAEFGLEADKVKEIRVEDIEKAPTVDPVKHGFWNDAESFTGDGSNTYECSKCGFVLQLMDGNPADNQYAYCPHCGAMMAYQSSKFPKIGNEVTG